LEVDRGRLRVARELVGFSQAQLALEIGISPAAVSQFESGAARPSPSTVGSLSDALQIPRGFLEQTLANTHEGFFRSLRRTAVADRRRARAVGYVAHDIARHAADHGAFPTTAIPQLAVDLGASVDELEPVAAEVRGKWRVPAGPIPDMVELLERHGVAVIRLPLESIDVDAFSLPFEDHPVVVLSTDKDDRARSRFDVAHELGHLVMHGSQMWGLPEIEKQAHSFAGAFLMPADELRDQLPSTVDWPRLFTLKRHWQVSLAALLMRARTLGVMSERTYLTAVKASSARGWRRMEPVPLGPPEQPRRLLDFIESDKSADLREWLPARLVTAIADASASRPT
jgi:Zn-dependent peptidase ImmA (M78 family)/transcriptional regulator with XRE-family HTH domain